MACDVLTSTLQNTSDRPEGLLLALRYERALVYEAQGERSRMRSELAKIFAEAPDYEDVARRLDDVLEGESEEEA